MREGDDVDATQEGLDTAVTKAEGPTSGALRVARHRARHGRRNEGRQPTHGMHALDRTLRVLGSRALDGRCAVSRQLVAWRADLVRDVGGDPSTQQTALIDLCTRQRLLVESIDAWLLTQQLIDEDHRELIPVLRQRQALADGLARYLAQLGLERRVRDADDVDVILAGLRKGGPA